MQKELNSTYSILKTNIECEHKIAGISPMDSVALHNHDGYEILLFLSGEVSMYGEALEKKLVPGDLILVPIYHFHGIRMTQQSTYERVVLNIRPEMVRKLSNPIVDLSQCFEWGSLCGLRIMNLSQETIEAILSLTDRLELCLKQHPYGWEILAESYLAQLLVLVNEQWQQQPMGEYRNMMPKMVLQTFKYVEEHLGEELTVRQVAEALYHNEDYLNRVFKETTGNSLKQYISHKRIATARQYLEQGIAPVEVCELTGFQNYSSFFRNFTKTVGCSPKQYRLLH